MTDPSTAREALIAEALGEAAKLLQQLEELTPVIRGAAQSLRDADVQHRSTLAAFESRVQQTTEDAKRQAAQHIARRVDESARHLIEQQGQAMANAASVAFGAEIGATLKGFQLLLQRSRELQPSRWETWLTHLATAAAASAATWYVALQTRTY